MIAYADFSGVIPSVVTLFITDREFDRANLKRPIDRMIDCGAHGLFLLGSSSEVVFRIDSHRRETVETGIEAAAGRVPVLVGVIGVQTERMVEHARAARELGADAVVATAPFYALGGPDEIEANLRAIREEVDLPLFAYDLPVCVHKELDADMLVGFGSEGALAGARDSSGNDVNFCFLIQKNRAAGSPFKLFMGHKVVVDGAFLSGADDVVPGLGNVDPYGYVQQYEACREGDWDAATQIQNRLALLMTIALVTESAMGFSTGVGAFKTVLQFSGVFETNQMSRPVRTLEGGNVEAVRNVFVAAGMLTR